MKNRFIVNPDLCTGCLTCELACSFSHSIDGKRGASRIRVRTTKHKELWVPVTCLQCEDPACVKSCLVDALSRNQDTGAIELNQDKCVKCMACIAGCPFGCSIFDDEHDMIIKCDLCEGDPVCAHFCPTKALTWKTIIADKKKQAV